VYDVNVVVNPGGLCVKMGMGGKFCGMLCKYKTQDECMCRWGCIVLWM